MSKKDQVDRSTIWIFARKSRSRGYGKSSVHQIVKQVRHVKPKRERLIIIWSTGIGWCIKSYRAQGHVMGSGPIEAVHRSVLQQRMKLSGQPWSAQVVQAIANLRCYRKADQWHIVQKVVNVAAWGRYVMHTIMDQLQKICTLFE